jgi:fumarate hydratase class I
MGVSPPGNGTAVTRPIRQDDFIDSIAAALQHISYFHPRDHVRALALAYERERSPAAKDALAQILMNSRLCMEGHRPVCQDTGIVVVFLRVGMNVRWDAAMSVEDMVNEGVRRAYDDPGNVLRKSIVSDPLGARRNTRDNTPAVIHTEIVPGDVVDVRLAAKGAGSENKAQFTTLNPSDDLVAWVLEVVPKMGAGWCPPGTLGIGVGGTAEKAMLLAKEALLDPIDMPDLKARGPSNRVEALRVEILDRVNALGIGAQGLGGLTTVLDVKILDYPTHAASLPVAIIPNCAATRHAHLTLDGSGPAYLPLPHASDWPAIEWAPAADARHVNLDTLTRDEAAAWRCGDRLLLSGRLLTGRDAAHKRLADLVARNEPLPNGLDFTNRLIYYVGPVEPVRDEVIGPAGPTTATRMDTFTDLMLGRLGLLGMIGKAERGPAAVAAIKAHKGVYLVAVGGAAYLVARAITAARVVAFDDLGMEAVREIVVDRMPVTVAVDAGGHSLHALGPAAWSKTGSGDSLRTT